MILMRFALFTLALGGMYLIIVPVSAAPATTPAPVDLVDLGPYLWRNRVLLVLASNAGDPAFAQQRDTFAGQDAGMSDRDLVLGLFTDDAGGMLGETAVSADAVSVLRVQIGVPNGQFAVVLIGKDGGVKLQRAAPVTADALFALIDTMPMREAEVARR